MANPYEKTTAADQVLSTVRGQEDMTMAAASAMLEQIMRPMLESMGQFMTKMSEAVEHIATSQDVMRNRLEALEKQVRLSTPVTEREEKYLKDAVRAKARTLLAEKQIEDKKAISKLAGLIKKSVLMRYGYGSFRDIPHCEYNVAMSQIETWNNALEVYEIVKEARERAEAAGNE